MSGEVYDRLEDLVSTWEVLCDVDDRTYLEPVVLEACDSSIVWQTIQGIYRPTDVLFDSAVWELRSAIDQRQRRSHHE